MRLHRLEITAFGPFAETVHVDFDALGEAGVFLLCGDTGAGKTTVLDAVCFALYGDLPSDRGVAKQLRSHFAAPGARPEVVLEADLAGRRLRFRRSPAWQRAKKRGTGTTTEQPHVLVEEHLATEWVALTNRLDEAGLLVAQLLGMTLAQFSQVVLLPQGQFDTFLSARSEDRQKVLTHLFHTGRFEDVERWLGERRRSLRRQSEGHRERVSTLLERIAEVTGLEPPHELGPTTLAASTEGGAVQRWTDALLASADLLVERTTEALGAAATARTAATLDLAQARSTHALQQRHERAREVLVDLAQGAERAARDHARLQAARRVARVLPLVELADLAAHEAETARARAAGSSTDVAALVAAYAAGSDDDLDLAARAALAAESAGDRATLARTLQPRAEELGNVETSLRRERARLSSIERERDDLETRLSPLPAEDERLTAWLTGLQEVAETHSTARAEVGHTLDRVDAQRRLSALRVELADALVQRDAALAEQQGARERLLDLRETRLRGMAAELAAAMAVGQDWPVCGSHEHPSRAVASVSAVTADDERAQQHRLDDADGHLASHEDRVRGLRGLCEEHARRLGDAADDPDRLRVEHDAARRALVTAAEAVEELRSLTEQRDALRVQSQDLRVRLTGAQRDHHAAEQSCAELVERADTIAGQLRELLGDQDTSARAVATLAAQHELAAATLTAARDALAERERSAAAARTAAHRARSAAEREGFTDLEAARLVVLDDARCAEVERALHDRAAKESRAHSEIDDPEVRQASFAPAPDVAALDLAATTATDEHAAAAGRSHAATERSTRLRRRADDLSQALADWSPVREELDVATSLAELAEGRGGDNVHQMRLSAYVLSARLSQVVAAANERLVDMSDGRYLLEHGAGRAVKDQRGGLGLRVRDLWTDELRDPVTLSGGETFVVSLALALGLADVVTGEAGGTRVDTLFVDEGFGSLDPDTLELVMDTLDQLREGGRVVGVVSHVPELRSRIGTQLLVRKTRRGSDVELQQVSA